MLSNLKVSSKSLVLAIAVTFAGISAADNTADSDVMQVAQTSDGFNAEQKYMASCFACHSTGAAGSPKVEAGSYDDQWAERLEKGMDAVMQNVVNGLGTMPAKGLCFDCTEADLRAIVEYMVATSQS